MSELPPRTKLNNVSETEAARLALLLDFMRERQEAGMPVLVPMPVGNQPVAPGAVVPGSVVPMPAIATPVRPRPRTVPERYNTRRLVAAMRRERSKSRTTAALLVVLSVLAVVWPLLHVAKL